MLKRALALLVPSKMCQTVEAVLCACRHGLQGHFSVATTMSDVKYALKCLRISILYAFDMLLKYFLYFAFSFNEFMLRIVY